MWDETETLNWLYDNVKRHMNRQMTLSEARKEPPELNWAGQPMGPWDSYGGRREHIPQGAYTGDRRARRILCALRAAGEEGHDSDADSRRCLPEERER
jgi:hypothetical protein